jgi:hypothetical protein
MLEIHSLFTMFIILVCIIFLKVYSMQARIIPEAYMKYLVHCS